MNEAITAAALWEYIEASRRATGRVPKFDALVEHFDGRRLCVLMSFADMPQARKDAIRQADREQARADYEAKSRRRA